MRRLRPLYPILALLFLFQPLTAEDYQYQYFHKDKKKYVPFSDYIPRIRLHYKTVPHYLEDYYLLYGMKQYYNVNSLQKNIDRLKTALNCRFRHPSMALVKVTSDREYLKYRRLLYMHINLLIMRNHLKIAARYDRRSIRFYDGAFGEEITKSLEIADRFYQKALPFWEKAKKYANDASRIPITTDLGTIESERYSIIHGDLNYLRIIQGYRKKIVRKREKLKGLMARWPDPIRRTGARTE